MVYETGITSAYDEGEAEALDLFYSRAVDWGDDYLVWAEEDDTSACLPDADSESALAGLGVCNEFDGLESSKFSTASEASLVSSPGAKFLYAGWYQEDFDNRTGEEIGIDAWFRRIMYIAGYIPGEDDPSGPGNTAPGMAIYSPDDGATFAPGASILFSGSAMDAEDGDLTSSLVWTSSLDGQIGIGGNFNAVLSGGVHTITIAVSDSGGLSTVNSVTITVESPVSQNVKMASLVGSSSTLNKNKWVATVDMTIDPALGGAVITGAWSEGGAFTCVTDSLGRCSAKLTVSTKTPSVILTIQNITLTGYEYDPNGVTTVTINKP